MKQFKRNPNQGGFTLIELLLVLAIIAALAVAAFVIFPRVQAGRAATSNAQILTAAQANLKSIYTSGKYDSLDTDVAIQAGLFPDSMVSGTDLLNEWDGDINVYGSDNTGTAAPTGARYFSIEFPNVPEDVCKRLVPATAGNFGRIQVGDTTVVFDQYAATQIDLDEADVLDACADGGVTITWTAN